MRSVLVVQKALINLLEKKTIFSNPYFKQDKSKEIRYSRHKEFNDEVANDFLNRPNKLNTEKLIYPKLLNPIFGD